MNECQALPAPPAAVITPGVEVGAQVAVEPAPEGLPTRPRARAGIELPLGALRSPLVRGLHSSTFRLNLSAFCGIGCV